MLLKGGHSVYGFRIGIIMLDSLIPRPVGDIGNAETFDFPVHYKIVKGATINKMVTSEINQSMLEPFIEAARELEAEDCKAITTSCGFLAGFQKVLSDAVNIPVFTSSLMQVKLASELIGSHQRVGILASSANSLTQEHFIGAGMEHVPVVIGGMDDSVCFKAMRTDNPEYDSDIMKQEALDAALKLKRENPDMGALVIECTNLSPYSSFIREALGIPVFDIITLINYINSTFSLKGYGVRF